jgi:hypothetical protein
MRSRIVRKKDFEILFTDVLSKISSREELDQAYDLLRKRHREFDAGLVENFRAKDRVFFEKRDTKILGTVVETKRSRIVVKGNDGSMWEVPASQLTKVQDTTRLSRKRRIRIPPKREDHTT